MALCTVKMKLLSLRLKKLLPIGINKVKGYVIWTTYATITEKSLFTKWWPRFQKYRRAEKTKHRILFLKIVLVHFSNTFRLNLMILTRLVNRNSRKREFYLQLMESSVLSPYTQSAFCKYFRMSDFDQFIAIS